MILSAKCDRVKGMKTIKFNYWNNKEKKMYLQPEGGWDNFPQLLNEGDEYLQFTGLLDKNGKEIYESDLIIFNSQEKKNRVEWLKDGCWGINGHPLGLAASQAEIIGNIYENPELLEN